MAALISEATRAKAFRNQSPGPFDVAVDAISPRIPSWAGESGTLLSQANIEHGGGRTVKAGPVNVGQARLGDTSTNIGNKAKRFNIRRPPAWDRVSRGIPTRLASVSHLTLRGGTVSPSMNPRSSVFVHRARTVRSTYMTTVGWTRSTPADVRPGSAAVHLAKWKAACLSWYQLIG